MKKILHIITRMDMGGSAQNTMENCIGTTARYEVVLVQGLSHESKMTPEETAVVDRQIAQAESQGVTIYWVPSLLRKISPLHDLRALLEVWKIIRKEKPDIVHTHTSKAGIIGRLAAILARSPIIIHTTHGHVFYGHFSKVVSHIFLWMERFFAKYTDKMVALTVGEKEDYLKYSLCPEHKIVRIHSGVKIDKFINANIDKEKSKKELGISQNSLIVGTVGWLLPIKGPMHLLNAMVPLWDKGVDCQLVYVGKGDLEDDLRSAAEANGYLDKIFFLGWRQDIHNIIPLFDLFVLPSLNEGMGRVLVEAMAAGKPCVASEVGGVPDLVTPGMTGILVPPGDEPALTSAIEEILTDPAKAEKMGNTGRRACQDFSLDAMIARLNWMYEVCLKD